MSDDVKETSASTRRSGRGGQPTTNADEARGGGGGNARARPSSQASASRASGNAAGPSARRSSLAGTLLKSTMQAIVARNEADKVPRQSATSRAQGAGGRSGGRGRSVGAGAQGGRGVGLATGSRSGGAGSAPPSSRGRRGDGSKPGAPATAPPAVTSRVESRTMKQASGKPPANNNSDKQPDRVQSPQAEATAGTTVAGVAVAAAVAGAVAGAAAASTPLKPAVVDNGAYAKTSAHETPTTEEQPVSTSSPNGMDKSNAPIEQAVSPPSLDGGIEQAVLPPSLNGVVELGASPPSPNGAGELAVGAAVAGAVAVAAAASTPLKPAFVDNGAHAKNSANETPTTEEQPVSTPSPNGMDKSNAPIEQTVSPLSLDGAGELAVGAAVAEAVAVAAAASTPLKPAVVDNGAHAKNYAHETPTTEEQPVSTPSPNGMDKSSAPIEQTVLPPSLNGADELAVAAAVAGAVAMAVAASTPLKPVVVDNGAHAKNSASETPTTEEQPVSTPSPNGMDKPNEPIEQTVSPLSLDGAIQQAVPTPSPNGEGEQGVPPPSPNGEGEQAVLPPSLNGADELAVGAAVAGAVAVAAAASTPLKPAVVDNGAHAKKSAHETPTTEDQPVSTPSPNGMDKSNAPIEQAVSPPSLYGAIQQAVPTPSPNGEGEQAVFPPSSNGPFEQAVLPPSPNGAGELAVGAAVAGAVAVAAAASTPLKPAVVDNGAHTKNSACETPTTEEQPVPTPSPNGMDKPNAPIEQTVSPLSLDGAIQQAVPTPSPNGEGEQAVFPPSSNGATELGVSPPSLNGAGELAVGAAMAGAVAVAAAASIPLKPAVVDNGAHAKNSANETPMMAEQPVSTLSPNGMDKPNEPIEQTVSPSLLDGAIGQGVPPPSPNGEGEQAVLPPSLNGADELAVGAAVAGAVAVAAAASTPLKPAFVDNGAHAKYSVHETPTTEEQPVSTPSPNGMDKSNAPIEQAVSPPSLDGAIEQAVPPLSPDGVSEQAVPPPSPNGAGEQAVPPPSSNGAIEPGVSSPSPDGAGEQVISPPPLNRTIEQAVLSPSLDEAGEQAASPPPPIGGRVAAPVLEEEGTVVEQDVANGGGVWGGVGSRRRLSRVAKLVVGALVCAAGAGVVDRCTLPPPCERSSLEHGSAPLMAGECLEWEGGSRGLFRLLPGVKAKSRLTVKEGGGTYSGPDGIEVPIGDVILQANGGVGGLLCGAERIMRKVTGRGDAQYTARTVRSQLVFGAGTFCRTYATPTPPAVFDALRHGEARFSGDGHLEVVGRGGKVVWSAVEGVGAAGGRASGGFRGAASPEAQTRGHGDRKARESKNRAPDATEKGSGDGRALKRKQRRSPNGDSLKPPGEEAAAKGGFFGRGRRG